MSNKKNPIIRTAVALTHSYVSWFLVTLFVLALAPQAAMFVWGWLAHITIDFCTHNHAAHAHFYPCSEWRFRSPISFYEKDYYGRQFIAVEHTVMALLVGYWAWQGSFQRVVHQLAMNWQVFAMLITYGILLALVGIAFRQAQESVESEPELVPAEIPLRN